MMIDKNFYKNFNFLRCPKCSFKKKLNFQSVCRKPLSISHEALHEVRTWKFNGLLLPSSRYHHRLVIVFFCRWYLNHASKFILIILWHIRKECFYIEKRREWVSERRRISHLLTTEKKKNAIMLICVSERVSTLNCPLVIDLTHIVYCYLFSFSFCASRSRKFIPKNAWNTHTHVVK